MHWDGFGKAPCVQPVHHARNVWRVQCRVCRHGASQHHGTRFEVHGQAGGIYLPTEVSSQGTSQLRQPPRSWVLLPCPGSLGPGPLWADVLVLTGTEGERTGLPCPPFYPVAQWLCGGEFKWFSKRLVRSTVCDSSRIGCVR